MKRHWAINGRFLTQPLTGVQRYGREIVTALDELVTDAHPLTRGLSLEVLVPPGLHERLPLRSIPIRTVGHGSGHLWEQLALASAVRGGLLSLCNSGPVTVRRQIVCIHDMNTWLAPASYSAQFRLAYRILMPALGRSARAITTVSHFSADQIVRLGIRPAGTVKVIPNGREHAMRWQPQRTRINASAVDQTSVLLIGSRAPHKNMQLLVGMAEQLRQAGLRLAIVGSRDARIFRDGDDKADATNMTWLGRVDDDDLAACLTRCLCLAFPSWTEGFGLPPLEAMTLGCPVVVSDRASLPEICGAGALYAAPDNPDQWLSQFSSLAKAQFRQHMIEQGYGAANRFSWTVSAEKYLQCIARLDGEKGE